MPGCACLAAQRVEQISIPLARVWSRATGFPQGRIEERGRASCRLGRVGYTGWGPRRPVHVWDTWLGKVVICGKKVQKGKLIGRWGWQSALTESMIFHFLVW